MALFAEGERAEDTEDVDHTHRSTQRMLINGDHRFPLAIF